MTNYIANKVQLIAYPGRIGKGLSDLYKFMKNGLSEAVGGVHILPPFRSNGDAGFSVINHKEIQSDYGNWSDVQSISDEFDLCLDLVLNHLSDESPEFKDFLARGYSSPYAEMFYNKKNHYFSQQDLHKVHIRREKESPWQEVSLASGEKAELWSTFSENQMDLDYTSPKTIELMKETLTFLIEKGVKLFRLDAFGYITKEPGTSCFIVEPKVYQTLCLLKEFVNSRGANLLPEIHDHMSHQFAISNRGMYSYGFALPVLLLHALETKDVTYLKNWLRICPHNQITVLDTHDGICIPDVEGLLPKEETAKLVDIVLTRGAGRLDRKKFNMKSKLESERNDEEQKLASKLDKLNRVGGIYQLTTTYLQALNNNKAAYIMARAIQMFVPGVPQVYYNGLLAGEPDHNLYVKTKDPREVNRKYYTLEDAMSRLTDNDVTRKQLELMHLRNTRPEFNGEFSLHSSPDGLLKLSWEKNNSCLILRANFDTLEYSIETELVA